MFHRAHRIEKKKDKDRDRDRKKKKLKEEAEDSPKSEVRLV